MIAVLCFLIFELRYLLVELTDFIRKVLGTVLEQIQFFPVIKTQHPVTTIFDSATVIFFMAGFAMFDLPFAGNGPFTVAKSMQAFDAGIIESGFEFCIQPGTARRFFQLQFVDQGIIVDGCRTCVTFCREAMINKSLLQSGIIHISGDGGVVTFIHQ